MDNSQLAHDLAIAKLYGSDLPADKLIEQYRQYYKELNDYLKSQTKQKSAKILNRPF